MAERKRQFLRQYPLPYLAAWRQWAGMSQPELAERAGVSMDAIRQWESGEREARAMYIGPLADALGIHRALLLNYDPAGGWGERLLRAQVARDMLAPFLVALADLRELGALDLLPEPEKETAPV